MLAEFDPLARACIKSVRKGLLCHFGKRRVELPLVSFNFNPVPQTPTYLSLFVVQALAPQVALPRTFRRKENRLAKTRYVQLPGGRLTSFGNRYGGDGEKRDKYSRVERARVLSRVLDREFGDMVSGMVLCTESASVWTVLEPESGK
jgi:hypothetical protein